MTTTQPLRHLAGVVSEHNRSEHKLDGHWIQTQRGRAVDLLNPTPADIDPNELACLLSRLHRFGGHTRFDLRPYTVAQHSVFVMLQLPENEHPHLLLAALLHDAHEAYLGIDMSRPLKAFLNSSWLKQVERAWDKAVAARFGFDVNLFCRHEVTHADAVALATEKRDLMAACDREWAELPEPAERIIVPFSPEFAATNFLTHLDNLLDKAT